MDFVQNTGASNGVSREALPSPTATLIALAAAGRNPTDITIPTQGSEASSGGGDDDAVIQSTSGATGSPKPAGSATANSSTQAAGTIGTGRVQPAVDPPPAQGSHEGPSMRAAAPEGFVTGFLTGLKASVVEFFSRDAASEYDAATDTWDKLDAAQRNTLLNRLYHHGATSIVSGITEYTTATLSTLSAPAWETLKSLGSGAYVLITDPAGVKEAAILRYEEFIKLTPTQQNDLILKHGAGIAFLTYVGGKLKEIGAPETAPKSGGLVSPEGTPVNPKATGRKINIYGERETAGFTDVATEPRFANGRPLSSTIGDKVASDISLRDAPLAPATLSEIQRITQSGARITYSAAAEGFEAQAQKLLNQFPNAKVIQKGTVTGADGVERGVLVIELP